MYGGPRLVLAQHGTGLCGLWEYSPAGSGDCRGSGPCTPLAPRGGLRTRGALGQKGPCNHKCDVSDRLTVRSLEQPP
jgi:hypothetical protein